MTAAKKAAQVIGSMQATEDGESKNKLLQFAIFERLWSEEVVRKKLQEQIETIESKREPIEVIDPTQEQIEAALDGESMAEMALGYRYSFGINVPASCEKSLTYYKKVAKKVAAKYFAKAANLGDPVGQSGLGLMYLKGYGVPRDPLKALNYFTMAADQVGIDGQLQLGMMYFMAQSNAAYLLDRGRTPFSRSQRRTNTSILLWKRAAAQGYSAAQVKLGDYYYYGWGTDIDFEMAASLYRKAAEQQYNAQAMFNLGYMHEKGLGMKQDWHLAKRQYDLAAVTNADAKVPVAIALLQIAVVGKLESIKETYIGKSTATKSKPTATTNKNAVDQQNNDNVGARKLRQLQIIYKLHKLTANNKCKYQN
ncbi:Protein sel-1 homolog 1 [Eumeta japonica]|uniref:Protein sel-1 homolog 1 n=1 Tax=Eumeta variegata TaxID=151549 RepID=A0A4C2A5W7_EUMVA|nr:Protein sel-1 homolog 1 [Eumeta japonica]